MTCPQERSPEDGNARAASHGHRKGRGLLLGMAHTHSYWVPTGAERPRAWGSSRPARATSGSRAHAGGSSCPSSSHLGWGVQQQETVSGTGDGRGSSTQHREAQARPSKLVLELFAVHMPICFVIAWLFLEATGVSRKPESVDCVSSVWGV